MITKLVFNGSILIARGKDEAGNYLLSLVKTNERREIDKVYPELKGKSDTDYGENPVRLYFKNKASIDALVTELILLKANQFEGIKEL